MNFCKKIKKFTINFLCVVFFIFLIFFISYIESSNFNNGFCIKCNTKYNAISRNNNGQTYYECPNCYYGTYY